MSGSTTIGTAVGTFFLGAILAVLVFWLVVRRHRNQRPPYRFDMPHPSPLDSMSPQRESSPPTFTPLGVGANTEIHSYTVLDNSVESRSRKRPNNYGPLDSYNPATPNSARQRTTDARSSPPGSSIPLRTTRRNSTSSHFSASSPTAGNPSQGPVHEVFVVHHDGGAPPPVTVYALPGSRVTELPPGYNFGGSRSPENATGSQPQLTLLGEHPEPVSPTPNLYYQRDQKASYTPRSDPAPPTSFSPPPDPTSPNMSSSDERTRATTSNRLLPSTPHLHSPPPISQSPPTLDLPASITSRTRGPRAMSPPDDKEQEFWK